MRFWLAYSAAILLGSCSSPSHDYTFIGKQAVVSTFSGVPGQMAADLNSVVTGSPATALFYSPSQLAIDSQGNLFMGDAGNQIYKIATSGEVSIFAGTAAGTPRDASGNPTAPPTNGNRLTADFYSPQGVAVDKAGNIYVADNSNQVVRKITTDGQVSTLAGSGSFGYNDGPPSTAQFYFPTSLAVDSSGIVYVADLYNHAIRKITPDGQVSTLAGSNGGGSPGTAVFGYANGPGSSALFHYPQYVAVDSHDNIYVTDENNVVRVITPSGVVSTVAGQSPAVAGNGGAPSVELDGTADQALFSGPKGITFDSKGNIYIADTGSQVIRRISGGGVTTIAGIPNHSGLVNGLGPASTFTNIVGIVADSSDNLFVSESNDRASGIAGNAIRKITFIAELP